MPGKYTEFDFDVDTFEDERNGIFDSLLDAFDSCPECGYEGPLDLKKKGYVCPECRNLVLPNR